LPASAGTLDDFRRRHVGIESNDADARIVAIALG
jgi:hypothetical protein